MHWVDLGGRWYIIGVLTAREVPETSSRAREEGTNQVDSAGRQAADQMPSAVQLRLRMLQMSPAFADLADGTLRALARRMGSVGLTARDTLRVGGQGGDVVVFLASGQIEESVADSTGKVLLTRRPAPGDLLILPAPRAANRYLTNIYGLTEAILLTIDRDALIEGLGPDVEKVAPALEKLWEQELEKAEAIAAQTASRTNAPIVAFYSAKGGSGTTTLAVNTAAALGRKFPREVLLVDLGAPFGHAVLFAAVSYTHLTLPTKA